MASDLLNPANCACFNIRRAARQITQAYDVALKPAGLQATQFTLLAMIDGCDTGNGILLTALAKQLGMDRTTLTRNLSLAEKKKWVRIREGQDRRERLIALTASGRRILAMATPLWREAQSGILDRLGAKNLQSLLNLTQRASS